MVLYIASAVVLKLTSQYARIVSSQKLKKLVIIRRSDGGVCGGECVGTRVGGNMR